MSKIWVKENRNSFTPLHEFGIHDINLTPGAVVQMIMTPALQEAINAGYIAEVVPIWDENYRAITGFQKAEKIVEVGTEKIIEEGEE